MSDRGMKTILVPTEQNTAMTPALETALMLARRFDSYMEGFALRPAVGDVVAMDPESSMTIVTVRENDAEMAKQARDFFQAFMTKHQVPPAMPAKTELSCAWLESAPSGHGFVGSY